jgi:putative ABC transport system permease protein
MSRLRALLSRLGALVRLRQMDRDMDDEIASHLAEATEDYIRGGMSPEEARLAALRSFGGVTQTRERHRGARSIVWVHDLRQDLAYALRMLRRSPGFAAVAVGSLALGIGANGAIFSLVNAVMLRTLPVHEADRLVQITRLLDGRPGVVSYPLFEHFRDNVKSISAAFAQQTANQSIIIDGEEELVSADLVSGSYSTMLGLEPAAGRLLQPTDDVASAPSPAAVVGYRYWQRRFGGAPSAIGKTFTSGGRVFTIVGVGPASFESATAGHVADLMLPLAMKITTGPQYRSSDFNWLNMLARLKPDATVSQVNAEVQVLFDAFVRRQASDVPEKERANILRQRALAQAAPDGFNPFRDSVAQPLLLLMGSVGLILMLACVNLSGMLLARTAARQREVAVRLALGAGRGRLVRQFLTETLLLALIGGAIGLAPAAWLSATLLALFVNGRDLVLSAAPDSRVLVFTAAAALLACVMAGLAPALQAARTNVNPMLKDAQTSRRHLVGEGLVVAQLAISMILIVGAALFIATLARLSAVDRGFKSDGLLVAAFRTARPYPAAREAAIRTALIDRLRALPGVQSASAGQLVPISGVLWDRAVRVEGYAFRNDESDKVAFNVIAPAYFATLGTPLVAGREFNDRDTDTAPKVAIVTESFARQFFGDRTALGRTVSSVDVTYEIVGVVRDSKYQNLREGTMKTMYIPWMQRRGDQPASYNYVLRAASGDPMRLAAGLDRLGRDVDPALRLRTAAAYDTVIGRSIATERIMAVLGGVFGLLALIVAGLGVFGVLAFQVARRTHEIGVRVALGASRARVMQLVLRQTVRIAAAGIAIGAGGALMLTGLARRILFGTTPTDPFTFAVAASVLFAVAMLAAWLPARRAARVDPLTALRHE